jgi:hypothetical protein
MGTFNVQVTAVGGHGCQREVKDGQTVYGCRRMDCPDCITREYVAQMQRSGASVSEAKLTHWPGEPSQVVDDLLTRKRQGSF